MFAYIYKSINNNKQIDYIVGAKTEEKIKTMALYHIKEFLMLNKAVSEISDESFLKKEIISAIENKDADKAIKAWGEFSKLELNSNILFHGINKITII